MGGPACITTAGECRLERVRVAQASYVAGETMPVVKDSATYLSDGRGIAGVGRTEDRMEASAVTGPYCRQCGTRNDSDARFCDSCGQTLA